MKKEFTLQNTTGFFNLNRSILRRIFTGAVLLFVFMLLSSVSFAQITLTDVRDTYVDSTAQTSNFGSSASLKVNRSAITQGQTTTYNLQNSYIEFDKTALPANYSAIDLVRATLKLYVNKVNVPALNGIYADGICGNVLSESTLTWNTQPNGCITNGVASQAITTANQYVTIDVTGVVSAMISVGFPKTLFIIYTSSGNVVFDSKDSGGNPPVLELELLKVKSVTGTSGLTGGGNNGNLLLSIADGGVTTSKIADGAVTSSKIANGAVGSTQLANNSVNSNNIVPGAVNNLQLADNSVTSNKISTSAVTTNQLNNGAVTDTKLADNSVTNSKLTDNSVTTNKISQGAVTTNQLGDGSVTEPKLAEGSVFSNKIAFGQVVKDLNGLTDSVSLIAGDNVTITPSGNTLTISAANGGTVSSTQPKINSQQLALLRWYDINKTDITVNVGPQPRGAVFDGAYIWTANYGSNTVSKVRVSDGAVIGTFTVGPQPYFIAFDGANIWTTNETDNTVTKLRASDGTRLLDIPVGQRPTGIAFDGEFIWVANNRFDNVTKIRAKDGQVIASYNVGNDPYAIVFDGTSIWVACANDGAPGYVTKLNPITGVIIGTYPAGNAADAIAFDGENIWVNSFDSGVVKKYKASDGTLLGTFNIGAGGAGVAFDGVYIWAAAYNSGTITKIKASTNEIIGTYSVGAQPNNVVFDGANIWLTLTGSGQITKR